VHLDWFSAKISKESYKTSIIFMINSISYRVEGGIWLQYGVIQLLKVQIPPEYLELNRNSFNFVES
jgi:hypothetical protein